MDWLIDPFASGIGRRALAEVLILALACGPLGIWLLLYRQTYAAESISHGMLPGLVLAALAGAPLLLGAAGGALAAAGVIALLARDPRISTDAGVAIGVTTLFGLGALLALSPDSPPRLEAILFGDLLGVTDGELVASAAVTALTVAGVAIAHRSLSLAAFDPVASRALGVRPALASLTVLVLLAVVTVVAVQGLGSLLVLALIVAPAAGIAGLVLSFHLEVAAGASVALCALALFALSLGGGGTAERRGRLPAELVADAG